MVMVHVLLFVLLSYTVVILIYHCCATTKDLFSNPMKFFSYLGVQQQAYMTFILHSSYVTGKNKYRLIAICPGSGSYQDLLHARLALDYPVNLKTDLYQKVLQVCIINVPKY